MARGLRIGWGLALTLPSPIPILPAPVTGDRQGVGPLVGKEKRCPRSSRFREDRCRGQSAKCGRSRTNAPGNCSTRIEPTRAPRLVTAACKARISPTASTNLLKTQFTLLKAKINPPLASALTKNAYLSWSRATFGKFGEISAA